MTLHLAIATALGLAALYLTWRLVRALEAIQDALSEGETSVCGFQVEQDADEVESEERRRR